MAPLMEASSVYASQLLDDALASQKKDGGLKLIVKNTFFDVDDADDSPGMLGLQRAQTAPVLQGGLSDVENDIGSDSDTEDERQMPIVSVPYGDEANVIAFPMYDTSCADTPEHFGACYEFFPMPSEVMGLPGSHDIMPAAYLQAQVDQWLPMGGQYTVAEQGDQPVPFFAAEAQMASQAPELDAQPFAMMSEVLPWQPEMESSGEEEWEVLEQAPQPFQPQTISQWRSRITGATYVYWTVDGNKLRSNDRLTVSPLFKLADGHVNAPPLPFKMMITPKIASDGKGGCSFRKACGSSIIQLKCEAPREELESYPITFFLSAGSGRPDGRRHAPRGPVTRNFAQSGIGGLPKDCEVFDLLDIMDLQSRTFVVCLEVLPPFQ